MWESKGAAEEVQLGDVRLLVLKNWQTRYQRDWQSKWDKSSTSVAPTLSVSVV